MGDATYANVYGNATTGDLTKSMRATNSGAAGERECRDKLVGGH